MTNREKGIEFEKNSVILLESLGFTNLKITETSGDYGVDIIADYDNTKYAIQCKNHKQKQGIRAIQEVMSGKVVYKANRCVIISKSDFTFNAIKLAQSNNVYLFTYDLLSDEVEKGNNWGFIVNHDKIKSYDTRIDNYFDVDIVKEYEKIKMEIGHTPRYKDLPSALGSSIIKTYGSFMNFIVKIGDKPNRCKKDKDELVNEYLRIKSKIGRTPKLTDMELHSSYPRYSFSSYPFSKLQEECGDRANVKRGLTKQDLDSAFDELTQKLGHYPRPSEIEEKGKYRFFNYKRLYGTFDKYLFSRNIDPKNVKNYIRYTKEEVLLIYILIRELLKTKGNYKKLSTRILDDDLKYKNSIILSSETIIRKFSSWNNFIDNISDIDISDEMESIMNKIKAKINSA